MGKLDGVSRELYPGETATMKAKLEQWKKENEKYGGFTLINTRVVERKTASGHKVLYKMKGYFNGSVG